MKNTGSTTLLHIFNTVNTSVVNEWALCTV